MDVITSRDNKILKQVKSLYTKEGRDDKGLFVIEGYRNVRDALKKGAGIDYLVVSEHCNCDMSFSSELKKYYVGDKLFAYLSDTVTPQGILAVCRMKAYSYSDIELKENSLIVVCENLQDPGNAGTVIRTADAAGAAAVIMTKGCVDIYNPKVVRSVMSSMFSLPIVRNKKIDSVFGFLEDKQIKSAAGALRRESTELFDANLRGRCAIFVGNEGNGLLPETVERCNTWVKIPMLGGAESLNASVAAAVMIYEHVRQNRA